LSADDEGPTDEERQYEARMGRTTKKFTNPYVEKERQAKEKLNRGVPSVGVGGESGISKLAAGAADYKSRFARESARQERVSRAERENEARQAAARAQEPGRFETVTRKIGSGIVHGVATGLGVSKEARAERAHLNEIRAEGAKRRRAAAEEAYLDESVNVGIKQGVAAANRPRLSTAQQIAKGLSEFSTEANKRLTATQSGLGEDLLAIAGGSRIAGQRTDILGRPVNTTNPLEKKVLVGYDSFNRPIYQTKRLVKVEYKRGNEVRTFRTVPKKKKKTGFDPFGF
jgi:hypothetical protein